MNLPRQPWQADPGAAPRRPTGLPTLTTGAAAWLYLAGVVALWVLIRVGADTWWLPTLVIYGPRWVWALPAAPLFPAAILWRRRALLPLLAALPVLAGPILGFCLPWRAALAGHSRGSPFRILTCNVDGDHLNAPALRSLLDEVRPDVVALQEWSDRDRDTLFGAEGWSVRVGRGVCLASRFPILNADALPEEHDWRDLVTRYELDGPAGPVRVYNLHLATPRDGLEAILARRRQGAPELRTNIAQRAEESAKASGWIGSAGGSPLVVGDFNMPVESAIFRQRWGRFTDAFSSAGFGLGHTKFTKWYGIRIDHILAGPGWRCGRCWVGPDVGSDHRPLIAELEWVVRKEAKEF